MTIRHYARLRHTAKVDVDRVPTDARGQPSRFATGG